MPISGKSKPRGVTNTVSSLGYLYLGQICRERYSLDGYRGYSNHLSLTKTLEQRTRVIGSMPIGGVLIVCFAYDLIKIS